MKKPLVSVVVLNYNGKKWLKGCFESVFSQDFKDFELILVDNNSSDDSVACTKKEFPKVKIIVSDKNLGFAAGNNLGVRNAKGELVVLLNNDVKVHQGWLKALVSSAEKNKDAVLFGSQVIDVLTEEKINSLRNTVNIFCNIVHDVYSSNNAFCASGCSLMFRKSIFQEPFDPDYFIYSEDVALGWLARLKGFKVLNVPDSIVDHYGTQTMSKMSELATYLSERNRIMNILLFYQKRTLLKLLPLLLPNFFFLLLSGTANGKFKPRFKGWLWLMANAGNLLKKRESVQRQRKVDDKELMRYMSYKYPGKSKPARLLNIFIHYYCKLLNMKTCEMVKK